jgi:putative SOS response-associated peptidase YedK
MCGRFNQSRERTKVVTTLSTDFIVEENNIGPGMRAVIYTSDGIVEGVFGFRPAWDPKKLFLNARAEGKGNEHNLAIGWSPGLHTMPSFRDSFKQRRCVVPVTGFIEGPEKERLKKPYLFAKADGDIFYLAGIWSPWVDTGTGEELASFAIITTPANVLTGHISHHRSPMMLPHAQVNTWVSNQTAQQLLLNMMAGGYVEPGIQITPLKPELVTSGRLHGPDTMEPAGEPLILIY